MTRTAKNYYPQAHTVGTGEQFHCPTCDELVNVGDTAWVENDDGPHCSAYCAGYAPAPYLGHLKATGERSRAERLAN